MRRASFSFQNVRRALKAALVGVAALSALACGEVNIAGPTTPQWSETGWAWSEVGSRNLQISGTLEALNGTCLEATLLLDGVELVGARSRCTEPTGCARLELQGSVASESGHHTIAFRVLRQSNENLDYVAHGSALVSREGLAWRGVTMPLGPKHATLGAGDTVSFDVEFIH